MKPTRSWLVMVALAVVLHGATALVTLCAALKCPRASSKVLFADRAADAARALRLEYGERAADALDRTPRIESRGGAFELRRGDRLERGAEVPPVTLQGPSGVPPGTPIDEVSAEAFRVVLPADARDAIEMHVPGHAVVRVHEEGAYGPAQRVTGAVSYARDGGRSYWTEGDEGYEEWLELAAGRAYAGRVVARWHIEGGTPRMHADAVLIADARGTTSLRVTAPRAWARSGRTVDARLGVEQDAITLEVDAGGEGVLVDPLWVATGSMAVARSDFWQGHGAELLPGGGVLVVGGTGSMGRLASAERYDPVSETWSSAGSMTVQRSLHATVRLADGRVLVTGGITATEYTATAELFDPVTGTWSSVPSMSIPRNRHTATLLPSGRVLVAGGHTGSLVTATAEIFDPATSTWSSVPPMSSPGLYRTATLLPSGDVLVTGGDTGTITAAAEIFSATTGTWSSASSMSTPRVAHTATLLPSGHVLVAGGSPLPAGSELATVEVFDPWTRTWSPAPPMSTPRVGHTATVLPSGRVLVAGGANSLGILATAELFNPVSGAWSSAPSMAVRRYRHVAAALADGRVLLAGGYNFTSIASAELFVDDDTVCPNGVLEAGEECDDGNTTSGDCCSPTCEIEPAGTLCRASAGACDVAELCDGAAPTCPADSLEPSSTVCRASAGTCDVAETCTGSAAACPGDTFAPADTVCRASAGVCDVAETCTGSSASCPSDAFEPSSTPCRASGGVCDVAESCTGTSAECPGDALQPSSTVCRAQIGACDRAETCTGSSAACPIDAFEPSSTLCRPSAGVCDAPESCTGTSAECPPDALEPSRTVCRESAGPCDAAESCTGAHAACPVDAFRPPSTACRASAGVCDVAETCTGDAAACPADQAAPEGTACGVTPSGDCDARDVCVGDIGATATCEPRFPGATVSCGTPGCTDGVATAAGWCDGAGSCEDGATRDCAPFVCRADACLDACTDDADCVAGLRCARGACVQMDDGGIAVDAGSADDDSGMVGDGSIAPPDGGVASPARGGCGCVVAGAAWRTPGTMLLAPLLVLAGAIRQRRRRAEGPRLRHRAPDELGRPAAHHGGLGDRHAAVGSGRGLRGPARGSAGRGRDRTRDVHGAAGQDARPRRYECPHHDLEHSAPARSAALDDRRGRHHIVRVAGGRVEELGPDIWTVPQPLVIGGADLGTRMTVMRAGGDLVLHSPARIDDALAGELERLGRVRWLVAPCAYHHLFVRRAKERWPEAEVLAVPGVRAKQPELAIDGMLTEGAPREWAGAIEAHLIAGMPKLDEVAFLHRASRTLVLTDFMFNIPHLESWLARTVLKAAGSYGGPKQTKLLRFLMKDRAAVKASRDVILSWDFDRVSVCHREIVERGGKDVFARATAWLG